VATFKVRQRVRIVAPDSEFVGREGTVTRICVSEPLMFNDTWTREPIVYCVCVDGYGAWDHESGMELGYKPSDLSPLTDPGADAFIERIKKLKPYDEPKVEPAKKCVHK
jgi:hypothetical protein